MRPMTHASASLLLAALLTGSVAGAATVPRYSAAHGDLSGIPGTVSTEYKYRFAVGSVTQKGVHYPLACNAHEAVTTMDGQDYGAYLQGALRDELTRHGMYFNSSSYVISATIDALSFKSTPGKNGKPGEGHWDMTVTINTTSIKPVVLKETLPFDVPGKGTPEDACMAAAVNFPAAVSEVLGTFIQQYL